MDHCDELIAESMDMMGISDGIPYASVKTDMTAWNEDYYSIPHPEGGVAVFRRV